MRAREPPTKISFSYVSGVVTGTRITKGVRSLSQWPTVSPSRTRTEKSSSIFGALSTGVLTDPYKSLDKVPVGTAFHGNEEKYDKIVESLFEVFVRG